MGREGGAERPFGKFVATLLLNVTDNLPRNFRVWYVWSGFALPKYFKFSEGEEQAGEGCANLRREGTQTILVLNFEGCQLLDIGRATSDI